MKPILPILSAFFLSAFSALATDRFDALAQIESQDDDSAVGPQGEVSRYQVLPEVWARTRHELTNVTLRPTDPAASKIVAKWVMQPRCIAFENRYHRAPTDFEFYILWHRPACYIGRAVPRAITTAEADRADRFANLCQRPETFASH